MGGKSRPKPPKATAQEKAFARRSEVALDKETEEENRRKKQLIRSTLGTSSLLSGLGGGSTPTFSGTSFTPQSASGGGRAATTSTLGSGAFASFSGFGGSGRGRGPGSFI